MPDREKVIKGLETCIKHIDRECPIGCPYHEICTKYEGRVVFQPVLRDAFELLKGQEKTSCNEKMLDKLFQLLADMEIDMPCEEMSCYTDYCEENCQFRYPQKECWRYFLSGKWKDE